MPPDPRVSRKSREIAQDGAKFVDMASPGAVSLIVGQGQGCATSLHLPGRRPNHFGRIQSDSGTALNNNLPFVKMLAACWQGLCRAVRWYFGLGLDYADTISTPAPKAIYGEVISLFGLAVTNFVALTVALQQTNAPPNFEMTLVYVIVVLTITIGMGVILNAEATEGPWPPSHLEDVSAWSAGLPKRKHAYERGSIMFTRIIICAVPALAIVVGVMAFTIRLPGQAVPRPVEIKVKKADPYRFKDTKADGLVVHASLGRDNYPDGVPSQLDGEILLDKALGADWIVADVAGRIINAPKDKATMKYQPFLRDQDPKQPNTWQFLLEELEYNREYQLTIYLYRRDKEKAPSAEVAQKLIGTGQSIMIRFKIPAK
jgi:hypothetical protein